MFQSFIQLTCSACLVRQHQEKLYIVIKNLSPDQLVKQRLSVSKEKRVFRSYEQHDRPSVRNGPFYALVGCEILTERHVSFTSGKTSLSQHRIVWISTEQPRNQEVVQRTTTTVTVHVQRRCGVNFLTLTFILSFSE